MNCTGKRCLAQYNKVDPATCPAVSYCPQATPPKTNADRIRAMSDEELAEFINMVWGNGRAALHPHNGWNDWLKEEVKGDGL